ncbi:hypothetical protein GDO81_011084 [Engystomops pustulosus]|uniref:Uncharacterized protein n=1 Tax=Engystomops pustulosus TaxID=76066 RepID=A0AAV7C4L6_ENGPU|nr:hypothetical protein GDO81_011084 [Engystomops pustulosus]
MCRLLFIGLLMSNAVQITTCPCALLSDEWRSPDVYIGTCPPLRTHLTAAMEVSMKYRTQGSLPIGTQKRTHYIPRIPEEAGTSTQGTPTAGHRLSQPEAPVVRVGTDEGPGEQPPLPVFRAPLAPPPDVPRFRRPAHDPCSAIIETSPYYVYFKIITDKEAERQDLQRVLCERTVVDKDLPRTAKYRHFRSYEH